MCSSFGLLGVESRDFSQAEKERTAQNGPGLSILSKYSCHFVNLYSLQAPLSFSA